MHLLFSYVIPLGGTLWSLAHDLEFALEYTVVTFMINKLHI